MKLTPLLLVSRDKKYLASRGCSGGCQGQEKYQPLVLGPNTTQQ